MNEVKSPKKPLIFYYAVVLLAVVLFNTLAMPWLAEHAIRDVDYNTFVTMTENGEMNRFSSSPVSNLSNKAKENSE